MSNVFSVATIWHSMTSIGISKILQRTNKLNWLRVALLPARAQIKFSNDVDWKMTIVVINGMMR